MATIYGKEVQPIEILDHDSHELHINEFMDSRYFGEPHWFAARAEIVNNRIKIEQLEAHIAGLERQIQGIAPKGRTAKADKS